MFALYYTNVKLLLWLLCLLLEWTGEGLLRTCSCQRGGKGGRVGADECQERKSWDWIRGQVPLTAPKPQSNRLICGRERPRVVQRTCFPSFIGFDWAGVRGGASVSLSHVKSAAYQTVRGRSLIKSRFVSLTVSRRAMKRHHKKTLNYCDLHVAATPAQAASFASFLWG